MNILIPAAGKGSRFAYSKYDLPKPNIPVDGEPMLVKAAKMLGFKGTYIFLIQKNDHTQDLADKLKAAFPRCKIGVIDYYTEGAAQTALLAKDLINLNEELVIANCDQIMNWGPWNTDVMLKNLRKYDAGVVTTYSSDPKHSYALLENNRVVDIKEKEVISNVALTGIHYWKDGRDFVRSAEFLIENNMRSSNDEFYIAPTYNILIKEGKKIGTHHISTDAIYFIGTPKDLEKYENR